MTNQEQSTELAALLNSDTSVEKARKAVQRVNIGGSPVVPFMDEKSQHEVSRTVLDLQKTGLIKQSPEKVMQETFKEDRYRISSHDNVLWVIRDWLHDEAFYQITLKKDDATLFTLEEVDRVLQDVELLKDELSKLYGEKFGEAVFGAEKVE